MNAQIHRPEWQRIEIWTLAIIIVGAILLVIAPRAADREQLGAPTATAVRLPAAAPAAAPQGEDLPFNAWDVIQYFSTVLEMPAEKGPGSTMVFENHHAQNPEDRWHIAVSVERKTVVVEFVAGGDYGLSLAREFFESPLFQRGESEQLYAMFAQAQNGPVKRLARFTVSMNYSQTNGQESLVLRFMAPNAA